MSQKTEFITMSLTDWAAKYKPFKNPYTSTGGIIIDYNCYDFKTYGDEMKMVQHAYKLNRFTIWTWLDSEYESDSLGFIENGLYFCNRTAYFITEIPWPENTYFEISI